MSEYQDYINSLAMDSMPEVPSIKGAGKYAEYIQSLADSESALDMSDTQTPAGESDYAKFIKDLQAKAPRSPMDSYQTPYAAGMDAQQLQWGRGVETLWNALGGDEDKIKGIIDWTESQSEQAGNTNIEGFMDKLAFAGGQVTAALGPVAAAAVLAPIAGATAATGALVTGVLSEALSSTGEITNKALELDPEYKGDLKTVAAGAAVGGAGSALQIKRFTPLVEPLTDLMTAVGKKSVTGTRLANIGGEAAKSAFVSGVTEGVQDASGSVAAHALTDTAIDGSKARAIAAAAGEEFLIGSVFGGAGGTIAGYNLDVAERQIEFDKQKIAELEAKDPLQVLQDEYGKLDPDAIVAPIQGATDSAGTWNLLAAKTFGKSTDYLRKRFANNKYVQTFAQQVHYDPRNPQKDLWTVNEDAAILKGNLDNIAADLIDAPAAEVEAAGKRRAEGTPDIGNPIDKALSELYDIALPSEYARVGRNKVDMSSPQWNDKTYLPINNRFNWEKARKNPAPYEAGIVKHLTESDKADLIPQVLKKFRMGIRKQEEQGTQLFDGNPIDTNVATAFQELAEKAIDDPSAVDKIGKKIKALSREQYTSSLKKSPLNLERLIPEMPQAFWEEFADKGTSLKDAITTDIHKKAEHLAYADRFGFNNEVAYELIGEAIIESHKPGQTPLNTMDIENMMDVLRLQQRLPTKTIKNPAVRRAMMAVKSYTGAMILGASALMSIPETVITGYKTGINSWARGVYRAIKDGSRESQRRSLASMEDIGHGLHDMTSLAAARIGETVNDMPKAETWFIQKMTGLPHVQFALSAITLKATDHNMRRVIDEYATATSPEKMRNAKRRLLQMGVDPDQAKRWRQAEYKKDHDFYRDSWIPRLYRSLRTTIVEPHAVDKPVWMGAEHWLLISQLKSFMFTFQNLVLNDSAKQLTQEGPGKNREIVLRAAPYMAAYVLGQAGILTLKEWMREGEVDEDKMDDKIIMAIGQQGLLSIVSDLYHGIAGRSGVLESVSPAAGFINRQIKGNVRLVDDIMSGEISAEDAVREVISINTPRTLIDPAVRAVTDEVLGERE